MKKLLYAIIVTCIGTILIGLNTKDHNQPVPEAVTIVEAVPEPIAPEAVPEPIPVVETIVEPPVQPQVVPTGSCSIAYDYDWPADIAYQICMKESGGNPGAANWGDNHMAWAGCNGSFGLMQINCSHGQLFDGAENMRVAYGMYKGWGNSFRAWTTCRYVSGCN